MAGFAEFERYDAIGLATLVRDKQISASELLDAAIERVESRNAAVNAVVSRLYDEARRAIDAGLPDGPFTGVPFLLKDIGATLAGTATTLGSRMFATFVADHDSELVARYRRSGLAIFGKTNTPEFGIVSTTEPQLFGPTKNPWNLAHSPGGSSGGAAAAVASGMVPAAHGNDGGGSIRIPASCCGLFGLKPTRARTPMGPDVGEGWGGMAVSHAITRTVRDSAALLDATAGPDVGDPYWAPPPARPFLEEVGVDPGRLRIAVCTEPWNGSLVDAECKEAVAAAAPSSPELLRGGHREAGVGKRQTVPISRVETDRAAELPGYPADQPEQSLENLLDRRHGRGFRHSAPRLAAGLDVAPEWVSPTASSSPYGGVAITLRSVAVSCTVQSV